MESFHHRLTTAKPRLSSRRTIDTLAACDHTTDIVLASTDVDDPRSVHRDRPRGMRDRQRWVLPSC
jgi:hypothetical protein